MMRIMLTGQADMSDAIAAVNEGHIFRFLTKPCDSTTLIKALAAGQQQYRLIMAERELLEKTLTGSIKVLMNILSLVNSEAFSRAERLRRYVTHLTAALQLEQSWQYETAAMLSQIGLVTLPHDIMEKFSGQQALTDQEVALVDSCPSVSHDLLADIPRLDKIAKMIAWQQEAYAGMHASAEFGQPLSDKNQIKIGAQLLKICLAYDHLRHREQYAHSAAINELQEQPGLYHPRIVQVLAGLPLQEKESVTREISVFDLDPRMILDQDVVTVKEVFLAAKGAEVTPTLITFLKNYAVRNEIDEMIKVKVIG
jgi:response regulator RpfG family c-di-GMP phosphodiesterase